MDTSTCYLEGLITPITRCTKRTRFFWKHDNLWTNIDLQHLLFTETSPCGSFCLIFCLFCSLSLHQVSAKHNLFGEPNKKVGIWKQYYLPELTFHVDQINFTFYVELPFVLFRFWVSFRLRLLFVLWLDFQIHPDSDQIKLFSLFFPIYLILATCIAGSINHL